MTKQALIIGLGRFGMGLARSLAERGVEVLAVDADPKRVDDAAGVVSEAATFDATDEEELGRAQPGARDLCVCAIGDESHEASILCTALLRQLGAPRIVARANSKLHGRILKMVGAHEVVNPLEDFGERFADKFVYERLKGELPLGDDLVVAEVEARDDFWGKTLAELRLPAKFGVTVVATRSEGGGGVKLPTGEQKVERRDTLVVVAKREALSKLAGE
jgi:trk system potassium uptake protein TrkA